MEIVLEAAADNFNGMSEVKRGSFISCCCIFITFIIYLAVAIEGVEPTEYAIVRNNWTQKVDTERVLDGGLRWVGFFNTLIIYPSIEISLEFSELDTAN